MFFPLPPAHCVNGTGAQISTNVPMYNRSAAPRLIAVTFTARSLRSMSHEVMEGRRAAVGPKLKTRYLTQEAGQRLQQPLVVSAKGRSEERPRLSQPAKPRCPELGLRAFSLLPAAAPINQYPISDIRYPISDIQYPISNIQYPISNTQYPIPNTQYPTPYALRPTPYAPTLYTLHPTP